MAIILFAMPGFSIAFLFSTVVGLTNAIPWAEPAIETLVYRADEWSPRPTGIPEEPSKLFRRDSIDIEVCGWRGGNLAYPAKCDSGSSCVHDTIHGFVGCCRTDGPCTRGVYTTCLDSKASGWLATPTLVDDGVTMCPENSQCYKNTYPGQYFQYSCGDPSSATSISTSYFGQPSDMRLQVVFTGITFDPTPTAAGSGGPTIAATATEAFGTGAAGGVSPAPAAKTSAPPPTASKANAGTVAGGTVAGIAGVALVGALAFFLLRRQSKNNKTRRSGSSFFERKDPFGQHEPIHQNYNRDEFVSPLTGHPNNSRGVDRAFDNDTAYHGGGGMAGSHHGSVHISHLPSSPFSTMAGGNPYADEEPAPPLPTGPHRYTDVSRHNSYSNRNVFDSAPKPLSERAYSTRSNRNTSSPQPPNPAQEQSMLLVTEIDNEIDDFSRSWSGEPHERSVGRDQSDDESDGGHQLQTATSVAIPQGRSVDREVQSESLRQMGRHHWQTAPNLRTVRSDVSSLHNGSPYQQARNITTSGPVQSQHRRRVTSNSSVSSNRDTPTPTMHVAAMSQATYPCEQEQSLLDEPTTSRERLDSNDTTYSDNPNFSHHFFSQSPRRPKPAPAKAERMSFGLTGAISEAISGSDGWRGSGIDGQGWSPAWSGIGGGWLEGQSGMAMATVEENKESSSEPYELPDTPLMRSRGTQRVNRIKRRPVSGVPILNSPSSLQTERGLRK